MSDRVSAARTFGAWLPCEDDERDELIASVGLSDHYHDLPRRQKLGEPVGTGRRAITPDTGDAQERVTAPVELSRFHGSTLALTAAAAALLTAAIALILIL
jgi:hypothetical protein